MISLLPSNGVFLAHWAVSYLASKSHLTALFLRLLLVTNSQMGSLVIVLRWSLVFKLFIGINPVGRTGSRIKQKSQTVI